ncbi:MAG: prolyl oligopeptidase family serine peptidase [Gemmatimonadaceae bacterium]|nr:prolyl oligopeptidase family serine peptidase [Gemmatimonadaceae bacterium]
MQRISAVLLAVLILAGCSGESATTNPTPGTTLTTAATRSHDLTVDGLTRNFIVYTPGGVSTTQALPVVVMLHGTSGDGQKFYNTSGWKEKCEEVKCIAVFPSSRSICYVDNGQPKNTTKWTIAGLVPCVAGQTFADDVKFMRQMVSFLKTTYVTDPKRFYVTGFSNGGSFSSKLWAEASDLFAAVASSSGFDELAPTTFSTVPFYFTVGEFDEDLAATAGYPQGFPLTESVLDIGLFRLIGSISLGRLGLNSTHTTTSTTSGITFRWTTPTSAGTEMLFSVIKGQTHEYPNGTNHPLSLASVFWAFFSTHTK